MPASLIHRGRWPSWLTAASVAVLMAIWWQPWVDEAVAPAAAPPAEAAAAPTIAERTPPTEPSSPAAASSEAATPTPALKLLGTVLGSAGSFATVRRTSDSQPLLLRVGDRVDGLSVTAIERDRVVLAGAAQPIVIKADTVPVPAPPPRSRAVSPLPTSQVEPPAYADGEAPWDAGPNFRH